MSLRPLLEVRNLEVHFPVKRSVFKRNPEMLRAVDDVSFTIDPGETLGLVGESGCGKSTLGHATLRLIEPTNGRVLFAGEDITFAKRPRLRALRRSFQIIFQDPYGTLDPRMTVTDIIGEALEVHGLAANRQDLCRRVDQLLMDVGLDGSHAERYPHEFSGGQRQRIGIARALAAEPAFIVCDEAVSALDVSVQAQIINLLHDLQNQRSLAYLFIAHDIAVVHHISRRILVMYLGKIVELAPAKTICQEPKHPYTQALVSAVPTLNSFARRDRIVLSGEPPSPIAPPAGCPFHPRCPVAEARCKIEPPVFRELEPGHWVSCHLA